MVGNDQTVAFTTTIGPGIVNAPVAPDAIYVGIGGSNPGVAVIDLNGFGQSTSSVLERMEQLERQLKELQQRLEESDVTE